MSADSWVEKVEWTPAPVPEAARALRDAGYSSHLATLLARRGVASESAATAFLTPAVDQLHDPRLLRGLDAAVDRLCHARAAAEKVALVGDYDVDGVSGTAILTAVLRARGVDVVPILPHRLRDGYGFQPVHAERARDAGAKVIVTIDCGTTSAAAAEAALDAGLEVVVTDHHLPGGAVLPEGVILINPRQDDCDYPFADLCGAGLALKLALAFAEACGEPVDPRILLRIACLGTIADLVPLLGENRVIAAVGLHELGRTRSQGLLALCRVARLQPPYTTTDVGFRIGPRLNAPGRLDSAEAALEILLARDASRAQELALQLDKWNRERQDEERRVAEEAREYFAKRSDAPALLMGWDEGWHRGVVGIAAGRLARELNRPTILLSLAENDATGSGRSISGIHLYDFLARFKDELPRFGGHAQAIGMTVPRAGLEALRDRLEGAAAEAWAAQVAVRRHRYELSLALAEITPAFFEELRRLEPHGEGNPQPLVRLRGPLHLRRAPRFFGHGHLSAQVEGGDGGRLGLVGWGWQERAAELIDGGFELLGRLEHDRYRGEVVLRLLDCRPAIGEDVPSVTKTAPRGAVDKLEIPA